MLDWRTAGIDDRFRAMLGLLEKVTLSPREVTPEDIAGVRAAGLSDCAILDATYVCMGFNIITRIANALGFDVPPDEVFSRASRFLLVFGYNILSGFWARGLYQQLTALRLLNRSATKGRSDFDPYVKKLTLLRKSVFSEPGALDPAIRQAIGEGRELPGPLGDYVKKVADDAHSVSDHDIDELHRARYTDDQIFEATVSAALGASLMRLEFMLLALRAAGSPAQNQESQ